MKTIGLQIAIGGVFTGASAFLAPTKAIGTLERSVDRLNAKKTKLDVDSSSFLLLDKRIKSTQSSLLKLRAIKDNLNSLDRQRSVLRGKLFDAIAMGASASIPVKLSIDFEDAMSDVNKVVNFSSDLESKAFGAQIVTMSMGMRMSAKGLASIAASGGQLGIAKKDLLGFTETIAKMSLAYDVSPDQAGDDMAKLMNIYGIGIDRATMLADAMNTLSDRGVATAADMLNVTKRIGGNAKMFGLSETKAAALGAAMLNLGKPPQIAATSINAMLVKLSTAEKQGKKFQKGLKNIGLTSSQLKKYIEKDAAGALDMFLAKLGKLPKEKQMGTIFDLFGMEFSDDIATLVGGLDNYRETMGTVADETNYLGSMQREFEKRNATTRASLERLKNSAIALGISIGNVLTPTVGSFFDTLSKNMKSIRKFIDEHQTLTKVVGGTITSLLGLGVASIAIGYAWNIMRSGFLRVKSAFIFGKWALSGFGLIADNTRSPINRLGSAMCGAGDCAGKGSRSIKGFKNSIKGLGGIGFAEAAGIFALAAAFLSLHVAIAYYAKKDIDLKRRANKKYDQLLEDKKELQERLKMQKKDWREDPLGVTWNRFMYGEQSKAEQDRLERQIKAVDRAIFKELNKAYDSNFHPDENTKKVSLAIGKTELIQK